MTAISCRRQHILSKYNNTLRKISTGQKSAEVGSVASEAEAQQTTPKKRIRNWKSYGFDFVDQRQDYLSMHVITGSTVVLLFWGAFFLLSYFPDMNEVNWSAREARILVRKREVLGLPLVDPNYIDPALIKLPPDEEVLQEDLII